MIKDRGGAPSKKPKDILKIVEKYIKSCVDTEDSVNLPSITGVRKTLDIAKSTLHEWEKNTPGLSNLLRQVTDLQYLKLVKGGLEGSYNPTITKLFLHGHGHSDKVDSTSEVTVKSVEIEFVKSKEKRPDEGK